MTIALTTSRLVLRVFEVTDLEDLYALDSDPEVMRYITAGIPASYAEIRDHVLPRLIASTRDDPNYGYWAAIEQRSGAFLGWFHFRPARDLPADIELGYRLCRSAWGQGYATEGARALVVRGLHELGLTRVIATAMAANRASIRVMEKAGLQYEADFTEWRFPGPDRAAVRYACDRDSGPPAP